MADPRQGGVRRDAALLRPPARGARRRRPARRRGRRPPTSRRTTRWWSPPAWRRGPRRSTGVDHPKVVVLRRRDLRRGVPIGQRVAVVGAGGIGVDVAGVPHPRREEDLDEWMAHWGVGDPALHPGGLTEKKPRTPGPRGAPAAAQGPPRSARASRKTSGWAHRAVLKDSGVHLVAGRDLRPRRRRRPARHRRRRRPGARGRPRRGVRGPGVGAHAVRRAGARRGRRRT